MIITLSPAKILDFESEASTRKSSQPLFLSNADELNNILSDLTVNEIGVLMKINPKQALEVYQYIQGFGMELTPQKQAASAYNGIAYGGLDSKSFNDEDWTFAQDHLVILSGLYGALRPLDLIKPYRFDFISRLETNSGNDLYKYWKDLITTFFAERLKNDDNVWLNLSSNEYSKVIDKKQLPANCNIITPIFKEDTPQGYKQIVVYAKKARGMMAKYIIKNKITDIEDIKQFEEEGYSYSPTLSKKNEWVFTR